MMPMLYWKRCKRCGNYFDQYIASDYCPKCRFIERRKENERREQGVGMY